MARGANSKLLFLTFLLCTMPYHDRLVQAYGPHSIWVAAVSQLLFGTSAALGTLTTYASYTSPNTPVVRAAVVVALANSAFSILAAVTVFGFLGFLSHATGVAIEQLVASGPALAFQV